MLAQLGLGQRQVADHQERVDQQEQREEREHLRPGLVDADLVDAEKQGGQHAARQRRGQAEEDLGSERGRHDVEARQAHRGHQGVEEADRAQNARRGDAGDQRAVAPSGGRQVMRGAEDQRGGGHAERDVVRERVHLDAEFGRTLEGAGDAAVELVEQHGDQHEPRRALQIAAAEGGVDRDHAEGHGGRRDEVGRDRARRHRVEELHGQPCNA